MAIERPTFHESWSRVCGLAPRLRAGARVRRQAFRGQLWWIVEDPSSARFFRLNEPGWRFIGLLDGRRTVADAWRICCEQAGDEAPTQGEAIGLLGQMYEANLLQAPSVADAEGLFRRQRRRSAREARGLLSNLLFVHISLLDPDRFLTRWTPLVAWLFTPLGFFLWLALLGVGAYHLLGRWDALASSASSVLAPENLILLYLAFAATKLLHELGHAFACKALGRARGEPCEVHTLGLMLLVLMPAPYVDATAAWALRSRTARVVVGAAGMMVELALAALAAVVWSRTPEAEPVHALAYNVMFIASVSTVLFNANPLLRYDGYYILCDLLDQPNLAHRSQEQVRHLVRRLVWGARRSVSPAHGPGEAAWLTAYGLASGVYRIAVCAGILLFIADQQLLLGAVLVLFVIAAWILTPLGRFIHFMFFSPELARCRGRAIWTTAGALAGAGLLLGLVPAPDHVRTGGVVEPAQFARVHAGADGFVRNVAPAGAAVSPVGPPVVACESDEWATRREVLGSERTRLTAARRLALGDDVAQAQRIERQIEAVDDQIRWADDNIGSLNVRAPLAGVWAPVDDLSLEGAFVRRGQALGDVLDLGSMVVRADAGQRIAALLIAGAEGIAEVRARGRAGQSSRGTIERITPAASVPPPPSPQAEAENRASDGPAREGDALEPQFEVRISLDEGHTLRPGQRVVARFRLSDKPLLSQAWRTVRQLAQERFRI